MKRLVFTAAAVLALTAPLAAPARADDTPCLQIGQVYDFKPVPGNRSLIVTDRARKKFRVNFMGVCHDLQFNLGLGFKSHGTGRLSCIARGDDVIAPDPAMPGQRCVISSVEAYTPAMEKADADAAAAAKAAAKP